MSCHEAGPHTDANADCISCHMPSRAAQDVGRARVTDHAIAKRPSASRPDQQDLRSFGEPAGDRELGLAWSRIGNVRRRSEDFEKAFGLLRRAYESGARDVETITAMAFLEDRNGNDVRANGFYEEARRLNAPAEALVNLGSAYASQGRLLDALPLWRQATERSPGLEAAWIKLASAYAALNRKTEAIEAARRCLVYHPDSSRVLELLNELER
jgi:tetratricopeptide (TPR) repeat protein